MSPNFQPLPANQAFDRLLQTYDSRTRERIKGAMSSLRVTPNDPVWLSVVVAVDLLEALREEKEGLRKTIDDASSRFNTKIVTALDRVQESASSLQSEASAVRDAGDAIHQVVREAGAEVARSVGEQIIAAHGEALRATIADRDAVRDIAKGYKVRTAALALLTTLLIGVILGGWLGFRIAPTMLAVSHAQRR